MTDWLAVYRSGSWKSAIVDESTRSRPGRKIQWASEVCGPRMGEIVLTCADNWLLVAQTDNPFELVWLKKELIHQ